MKLIVQNMTCGHCVSSVTKAIQNLAAEAVVHVDLTSKEVSVEGNLQPEQVILAIQTAGFTEVSIKQ